MIDYYIADLIGIIGVLCVLTTYLFLQTSFIKVSDISYSFFNGMGALLILYSLYFHWNTASVIIEIAWFTISLYGGVKGWKRKQVS